MANLEKAIEIAARAHNGQRQRNGLPYILHPLHLMFSVSSIPEQIVAVLHDVVEDTPVTFDDLRRESFAPEIIEALQFLTHSADDDYDAYVDRLAHNPIARKVKLADLKHNMDVTRLKEMSAIDAARIEKYHRAWAKLSGIK